MKKSISKLVGMSLAIGALTSGAAHGEDYPYYIDEDSIRTFGPGCSSQDELFIDFQDGAASIIFANLETTAVDAPTYSNCTVLFDVYADRGYKISAPTVEMGVNYSIDEGGKGIASAKMTTLGESRLADVKDLYGTGSDIIASPVAHSPKYSKCGGKMTFRVTGRLTAIAPRLGGFATLTMDDANTDYPYSIKCRIKPKPCH